MKIGFIGFGEIGSSLYNVYKEKTNLCLKVYDPFKNKEDSLHNCDIINVCIPYISFNIFYTGLKKIKKKKDCIIIIHSTVELGTTRRLSEKLPQYTFIHSPVRGVHPYLSEGIKTFTKYIGKTKDTIDNYLVLFHYIYDLGIKCKIVDSRDSELAKIASTTLYGLNISAITDLSILCEKENLDFNIVFTDWQKTYNEGYTALGRPEVCRPILTPIPKDEDGNRVIGGHCVIPNAKILRNMGEKDLSLFILRYS